MPVLILPNSSTRKIQSKQFFNSSISQTVYYMTKWRHEENSWSWLTRVFHMNSGIHLILFVHRTSRSQCFIKSYQKSWIQSKMVKFSKIALMQWKRFWVTSMMEWKSRKLLLASWASWCKTFLTLLKLRQESLGRISVSSISGTPLNKWCAYQDLMLTMKSNSSLHMTIF